MNLIAEEKKVIELLSNNESLLSGELKKIMIYHQDNQLNIDLTIDLLYSKIYKTIIIRFINIVEYSLSYNSNNNFYFIEEYKFFNEGEFIYISLDPVDGSNIEIDRNDNDYILAKNVLLYQVN